MDWKDKAHREIANMCMASFMASNTKPDGTRYKKHRPYSVPGTAVDLIECLDKNNEEGAKAIFVWKLI